MPRGLTRRYRDLRLETQPVLDLGRLCQKFAKYLEEQASQLAEWQNWQQRLQERIASEVPTTIAAQESTMPRSEVEDILDTLSSIMNTMKSTLDTAIQDAPDEDPYLLYRRHQVISGLNSVARRASQTSNGEYSDNDMPPYERPPSYIQSQRDESWRGSRDARRRSMRTYLEIQHDNEVARDLTGNRRRDRRAADHQAIPGIFVNGRPVVGSYVDSDESSSDDSDARSRVS
ncbi:hypothetical protein PMZ80_000149 [Knufia obscura]|uniref:Uncharacterized protein n=1 Tax=Knufia obscura TaxID=1635080 RepID=A0ABR0S0I7_9EURO|nr:hypothetical protein PMZ80_000149 [Knufia obscura]